MSGEGCLHKHYHECVQHLKDQLLNQDVKELEWLSKFCNHIISLIESGLLRAQIQNESLCLLARQLQNKSEGCLVSEVLSIKQYLGQDICRDAHAGHHGASQAYQSSRSADGQKTSAGSAILIGILKVIGSNGPKPKYGPELCLQDQTGRILVKVCCEKCDSVVTMIDKIVAVRNWTLIWPLHSEVFLEMNTAPLVLSAPLHSAPSVPAVSPSDAWRLLNIKLPATETQFLVTVTGKITAVSEIIKIKESCLFLLQFSSGFTVIIKRTEFLYWQLLLHPQRDYVITHLKPTTLQKGASHQSRVYTVTSHSCLFPTDYVAIETKTAEEWLHGKDVHYQDTIPDDIPNLETSKLISFQGEVTGILDASLGVFELDNSVRLFISIVPAVHKFRHLQIGARVTVHNVHYRQAKQAPKLTLYMCMMSSVHFSCYSSEPYIQPLTCSSVMSRCRYLHKMCQAQLDFLSVTRTNLHSQLQGLVGNRYVSKVIDAIFKEPLLSWQHDTKHNRKYVDEFLCQPHDCSLLEQNKEPCPKYISVQQLVDSLVSQTDRKDNWCHVQKPLMPGQVLVGMLSVSNKTGVTQLADSTGSIDCVVCCYHGDDEHVCSNGDGQHLCSESCICVKSDVVTRLPCPFLHTCCLGNMVAVTKCEIVTEFETQVINKDDDQGDQNKMTSWKHYICFNLKDVFSLCCTKSAEQQSKGVTSLVAEYFNRKTEKGRDGNEKEKMSASNGTDEHCSKGLHADHRLVASSVEAGTSAVRQREGVKSGDVAAGSGGDMIQMLGPVLHRHVSGQIYFCTNKDCLPVNQRNQTVSKPVGATSDVNEAKLNDEEGVHYADCLNVKPMGALKTKMIRISCNAETQRRELIKPKLDKCSEKNVKNDVVVVNDSDEGEDIENKSCMSTESKPLKRPIELKKGPMVESRLQIKQAHVIGESSQIQGKVELGVQTKEFNPAEKLSLDSKCVLHVCRKEALSKTTSQPGEVVRSFVVEAVILDGSDSPRKDLFHFHGDAVRWYPVLHCDAAYNLSIPQDCSPLLSARLSNWKVEKVIQTSKVKKNYNVSELVTVETVFVPEDVRQREDSRSIMDINFILSLGCPDKVVDVRGVILERSLMSPSRSREQHRYRKARSMQQAAYASEGFGHPCTQLVIKDLTDSSDIVVYLNHETVSIPPGLIPGTVVNLSSLERKVAKSGTVYLRALPTSSIQVMCLTRKQLSRPTQQTDNAESTDMGRASYCSLVDIWSQKSKVKVRCVCDLLKVQRLSLKCVCTNCGSLVVRDRCTNVSCFGGEDCNFQARANIIIDDGTSVAMVTVWGENVRRLMSLSENQWSDVSHQVNRIGELFIQQSGSYDDDPLVQFVRQLCDCPQVKQTWSFTLQHKGNSWRDLNTLELEEFIQKSFDTGSTRISTHCLPFLYLDCVAVETFNPSSIALELLQETME